MAESRLHERCACGSSLSSSSSFAASRPFTLAGTKRVYERPRPFTVRHIALDLALDIDAKSIEGSARLDVVRLDPAATKITLDALGFEIAAVEIAVSQAEGEASSVKRASKAPPAKASAKGAKGKGAKAQASAKGKASDGAGFSAADYSYDGEALRVTVPEGAAEASIRVQYRAVPRRGMYFLAPDEHVPERPRQVWTQCQDEDARHIFPCVDKPHIKQTTELRVKIPAGWTCLSNGELLSPAKDQKQGIFHFRLDEPHPSYLFTLVAGEFTRIEEEVNGVPLAYLVPRGREEDGKRTFARTPEMIRHFGEKLGVPYPWKRYSQVVVSDFIFGGMENTTATTMYEHILLDERAAIDISSDDLIAHELAHQWFGDLVTCRDWSHGWLNEGFATFMEHVDREHHLGRDEYEHGLVGDMDAYLGEAKGRYRRPVVCLDYDVPIDLFDRHLYEKGGLVLHLLRRELGDELFWRAVNTYLTRHARGVVETRDLQRAFEDTSGRSLERFFEQWVFRSGHAEVEVKIEFDDTLCTVTVKQSHGPGGSRDARDHGPSTDAAPSAFAFDLVLDFGFGEVQREVRRVEQATHTFAIPLPRRPKFVVVDPDLRVLGELSVEAPVDLLRGQLAHAPTARGRALAAHLLGKKDDPVTVKALSRTLGDEKEFWGVRAEAAEALGRIRSDEALSILIGRVDLKHAKVRRAVVRALGRFRSNKAAEALQKLALRDASYLVEAESARALGATRQTAAFDTLVEILDRPSWGDVIRSGALDGLAHLRDDRALPHVLARTRYGVPARGRRAAILALPRIGADRKIREALEDLLDTADPHVRVDVIRALAELGDPKARGAMQRALDRELDGRVRRRLREVLRDLAGAGRREADRLRDELETLRREHHELKARVSKLEGVSSAQKGAKKGESKP
ncbi:M1 family aminopeptidase [Chondromyces crocatus]|uniref:Aminopeptidase N n=1 Tax=Chondromyces crocatus TaxID=52 RepID=A0A0K1E5F3_CHOCO|nr:M1 family aminopeptidase [Chondromyces crocatus]AKT36064.1 peptidase M1 [Chondromyces crocatus]